MQAKKQVRSRLVFKKDGFTVKKKSYVDVTGTYNISRRDFFDRNIDMEVETDNGERLLIMKEMISCIREIKVVKQVVEEVGTTEQSEPSQE